MASVGSEEFKEAELELTNGKKEEPEPDAKKIREEDVKWLSVCFEKNDILPFHKGEQKYWEIDIDVRTGIIEDWRFGEANICAKIGGYAIYTLYDEKGNTLLRTEYCSVPSCLGGKYGDYMEVKVDFDGGIQDWNFNLKDCLYTFLDSDEDDS